MTAEAMYFLTGGRHHDVLLEVLKDLESVQLGYPDELVPDQAIRLQAGIWEWLKAYGRRDVDGSIDETYTPPLEAWRPSSLQVAAQATGLPVPADDVSPAQLLALVEQARQIVALFDATAQDEAADHG